MEGAPWEGPFSRSGASAGKWLTGSSKGGFSDWWRANLEGAQSVPLWLPEAEVGLHAEPDASPLLPPIVPATFQPWPVFEVFPPPILIYETSSHLFIKECISFPVLSKLNFHLLSQTVTLSLFPCCPSSVSLCVYIFSEVLSLLFTSGAQHFRSSLESLLLLHLNKEPQTLSLQLRLPTSWVHLKVKSFLPVGWDTCCLLMHL